MRPSRTFRHASGRSACRKRCATESPTGFYSLSNYDQGLQNGVKLVMVGGEITLNAGTWMGNGNWGVAGNNASYVDSCWYLDWNHRYRNYTNAQYWGVGRWTSIVKGKRMVDGREVPGWETSGTYSTPIANNATFFWFGGPGALWN